jgi:purine-binding chemotaxis protein CheW
MCPANKENSEEQIQLACFRVGGEHYALDILKIKEITRSQSITRIPKAPEFIEGVINLRGVFIPVVDLRKRFGLPAQEPDRNTRIIIATIAGRIVGIQVDEAKEVIRISQKEIKPPPRIVRGIESEYLKGICRGGEEILMFLDFEKILSTKEKIRLDEIKKAVKELKAKPEKKTKKVSGKSTTKVKKITKVKKTTK